MEGSGNKQLRWDTWKCALGYICVSANQAEGESACFHPPEGLHCSTANNVGGIRPSREKIGTNLITRVILCDNCGRKRLSLKQA